MTTVSQWLTAPLAHIERSEREHHARMQALYEDDTPSGCDCGALALCARHRREYED